MPHHRPVRSAGFTVMELLTVVAIVIVVLALVAPAMQRSQAQARLAQCRNNLHSVGLALHNYYDVYGTLPPAWTALHPHPQSDARFGWSAALLPYIDNAALYNQLDFNQSLPLEDPIVRTAVPMLRCPSDRAPAVNPLRSNLGTSNYSGNGGDQPFPRWAAGRLSADWPGQVDAVYASQSTRGLSGVMWLNGRCGFRDMTDGPSQTIFVGERSYASGAGVWPGVGSNEFENDVITECSYASPMNRAVTSFSSRHEGGVNFLMGDGHVRFLSDGIESARSPGDPPGVYQKLANKSDGLLLDDR